ncbi:MAG: F0F1 ATP synthase subunit delta [Beijerinckiaceae bacterium]|nr:F0F1 ATP synthase subunit delta [Beijerinckiaceae bacterium]
MNSCDGLCPTPVQRLFRVAKEETIVTGMAGRYASALFELAREQRATAQVAADLDRFKAMLAESADLARLVRSPAFSAEEQVKALGAVLEKAGISGLTAKFLKLVATKRRLFALPVMIADFGKLHDAERGVSRAQVTVAEPLSPANLAALRVALTDVAGANSVDMDVKVDPSIIGGLIVKLGSRMVDGSLKTKLNSIRTRMKEVG